ncbi:MAG: polyphosphate polymerase domain-containing protein, partial [Clostridia bacterium]|nr:polyphosphate polymerase domain-containing protein [Clostridia bacterium]
MQEIFKRVEKKYLLTKEQREKLLHKINEHLVPDEYGPSTVCNIYFDTDAHDLIRESMDKPIYKEKVRMRSYNVPEEDSKVFLEIKKKFDGIVYKRRITSELSNIEGYIENGTNFDCNEQIKKEIDYCFEYYDLKPMLFLSYDRVAFYDKDNHDFRLTFDTNLISRDYDLELEKGVYGEKILNDD